MPQFVVVSANTLAELETRVNDHMERFKFEPVGGVCYSNHAACYVQSGLIPDKTNYPPIGEVNTTVRVKESGISPAVDRVLEKRRREGGK